MDTLVDKLRADMEEEGEMDCLKGLCDRDGEDDQDGVANQCTIYFGSIPTKVDCNIPKLGQPMVMEGNVDESNTKRHSPKL